jgi:hypothetical protein
VTKTEGLRLVSAGTAKLLSRRPLAIVFVTTRVVVRWPDATFSEGEADVIARVMAGGL